MYKGKGFSDRPGKWNRFIELYTIRIAFWPFPPYPFTLPFFVFYGLSYHSTFDYVRSFFYFKNRSFVVFTRLPNRFSVFGRCHKSEETFIECRFR